METIKLQIPVLIEDLGVMPISKNSKYKKRFGLYKCSCGNEFKTIIASINSGNTKSCGCINLKCIIKRNTTHGMANHKIYKCWYNMINRVTNPKNNRFSNYGGRGITICERWKIFTNFMEDMLPSYQQGLSIDRINNDGNYEPSNCRWTTKTVQARNTRILRSDNTSGYRGVSLNSDNKKWDVFISVNGKRIFLGRFKTAIIAARVYDDYAIMNNLEHTRNFN